MSHVALRTGVFSPGANSVSSWLIMFLLLIPYVTMWPWPLGLDLERLKCIGYYVRTLCNKIEAKLNISRPSYSDLKIKNLGPSAIQKWIWTIHWPRVSQNAAAYYISAYSLRLSTKAWPCWIGWWDHHVDTNPARRLVTSLVCQMSHTAIVPFALLCSMALIEVCVSHRLSWCMWYNMT